MADFGSISVGDSVWISQRMGGRIAEVTHVTKTQFHCGLTKFRKDDGKVIGHSVWNTYYATHVQDRHHELMERAALCRQIKGASFGSLSTETLRKIADILKSEESKP